MSTDDNAKPTSSFEEELNRHLHEIFARQDDPNYLLIKKIEQARESRFDTTDLSL